MLTIFVISDSIIIGIVSFLAPNFKCYYHVLITMLAIIISTIIIITTSSFNIIIITLISIFIIIDRQYEMLEPKVKCHSIQSTKGRGWTSESPL